jgi:hypothetical protein
LEGFSTGTREGFSTRTATQSCTSACISRWASFIESAAQNPPNGKEYYPYMLNMVLESLWKRGKIIPYYKRLLNVRTNTIQNEELQNFAL